MSIRAPRNSAASIRPRCRSTPAWPSSPRWRRPWRRSPARAWDNETKAARADYLEWSTPPQVEGPIQMGEIVDWLEQRLPADAILTNGAGNYATWIHRFHRYRRFRTQLAPDQRLDGLWRAGGGRGQGDRAGPHGGLLQWRRLLHDERPGAGDGRAVQCAGDLRGREQRHLRHHPHASGARLSRPRLRHRPGQSGFRRAGPRLWRPWRTGGADRRLRPRVRARGQGRQAGADRDPPQRGESSRRARPCPRSAPPR